MIAFVVRISDIVKSQLHIMCQEASMISELQAIKRLLSLKCAIPSDFKITNCLKVRVTNQPVNRRRFTVRFFFEILKFFH